MITAAYFTNWSIYGRAYAPSKLPVEALTHVIYAFAKPDQTTGAVALSDPWADVEKPMDLGGHGCLEELKILRSQRNPALRIVLSVGGWTWSPDLGVIFADPNKVATFVRSAVNLVKTYGLDGLDVDWEYPDTPAKGAQLVTVLRLLRSQLGEGADLTIAAPALPAIIEAMPLREIDALISFWNIMAYDYSGPWSARAAHHANLYGGDLSADCTINSYRKKIPAGHLVLGMPLYGRSFSHCSGIGQPYEDTLPSQFEKGLHDYKTLPLEGARESLDQRAGTACCVGTGPDGAPYVITYDNKAAAAAKARYVIKNKLGGGMWWEASGDAAPECSSLIHAFVDVLNSSL